MTAEASASRGEIDDRLALGIGEDRRVDVVLLHRALVDREVTPEPATGAGERLFLLLADRQAQVVLGHPEVNGRAPRRTAAL